MEIPSPQVATIVGLDFQLIFDQQKYNVSLWNLVYFSKRIRTLILSDPTVRSLYVPITSSKDKIEDLLKFFNYQQIQINEGNYSFLWSCALFFDVQALIIYIGQSINQFLKPETVFNFFPHDCRDPWAIYNIIEYIMAYPDLQRSIPEDISKEIRLAIYTHQNCALTASEKYEIAMSFLPTDISAAYDIISTIDFTQLSPAQIRQLSQYFEISGPLWISFTTKIRNTDLSVIRSPSQEQIKSSIKQFTPQQPQTAYMQQSQNTQQYQMQSPNIQQQQQIYQQQQYQNVYQQQQQQIYMQIPQITQEQFNSMTPQQQQQYIQYYQQAQYQMQQQYYQQMQQQQQQQQMSSGQSSNPSSSGSTQQSQQTPLQNQYYQQIPQQQQMSSGPPSNPSSNGSTHKQNSKHDIQIIQSKQHDQITIQQQPIVVEKPDIKPKLQTVTQPIPKPTVSIPQNKSLNVNIPNAKPNPVIEAQTRNTLIIAKPKPVAHIEEEDDDEGEEEEESNEEEEEEDNGLNEEVLDEVPPKDLSDNRDPMNGVFQYLTSQLGSPVRYHLVTMDCGGVKHKVLKYLIDHNDTDHWWSNRDKTRGHSYDDAWIKLSFVGHKLKLTSYSFKCTISAPYCAQPKSWRIYGANKRRGQKWPKDDDWDLLDEEKEIKKMNMPNALQNFPISKKKQDYYTDYMITLQENFSKHEEGKFFLTKLEFFGDLQYNDD